MPGKQKDLFRKTELDIGSTGSRLKATVMDHVPGMKDRFSSAGVAHFPDIPFIDIDGHRIGPILQLDQ